jgi:hypothetical protein
MGLETQRLGSEYDILQAQKAAQRQNYNLVTYVRPRTDNPETEVVESGLETRTVDPRDPEDIAKATKEGFVSESVYKTEMGRDTEPVTREDRFLIDNADAFADGTLSEKDLATFETIVSREYITPASTSVYVPGKGYVIPEISVPQFLIDANQKRIDKGLSGFNLEGSAQQGPAGARTDVENLPKPTLSTEYPREGGLPEGFEELPKSVAYEDFQKAVDTKNLGDAFGTGAALSNFFNKFFGIFEMGVPNEAVATYIDTYQTNRRQAVLSQMMALEGKKSQEFFNQEYANFPEPASFLTYDSKAVNKLRSIVANLREKLAIANRKLNDSIIAGDQPSLEKQTQAITELESALGFWGRFYNDLAADVSGSIPSDAEIADAVRRVREKRGL